MNLVHTLSMNMRLTISLPEYLYWQVKKQAKPGKVSGFASQALECKVSQNIVKAMVDPWEDFLNAGRLVTKQNKKISIKKAIEEGRM